jgi:plasmid stabilization system protein ParE
VPWQLEILPRAEDEVAQTQAWYEERRTGLGGRFLAEVEATIDAIAQSPERFPRWLDDLRYRRALLSRFPFVVMFVVDPATSTVTIVAVAHTSREPGYWK